MGAVDTPALVSYIVIRYVLGDMGKTIGAVDFRALAEFRYQIRRFLIVSERIARSAGLRPQQYMLLLALKGLPDSLEPSILVLAERLQIRHNSTVELVNRLASRGLVRRCRSGSDSRKILVRLTSAGSSLMHRLVQRRYDELVSSQPMLVASLKRIITIAGNKAAKSEPHNRGKEAM